jgi:hypothetical protein
VFAAVPAVEVEKLPPAGTAGTLPAPLSALEIPPEILAAWLHNQSLMT